LSSSNETGNLNLTGSTLPIGFVNTGVNLGGVANTANQTGVISVNTGTTGLSNQNLGIEQPPIAGSGINNAGNNPGGTIQVTFPANTFTNTGFSSDPTLVTAISLTAFPTGATSIVIGGVSYTTLAAIQAAYPNGIPTDGNGNPTPFITVDPAAPGSTTVTISFKAMDAAGQLSNNTGTAVLNFIASTTIAGNVWNDVNGNAINGSEGPITSGVWVNLVDPATNDVIQTVPVDGSGNYSFTGLPQNTNYNIILSNANETGNLNLTGSTLPAGFVNTGVNLSGTAISANQTGVIAVNTGTGGLNNQNFGIEQLPTAGSGERSEVNPGGANSVVLPAGTFTNNMASSDITPGTISGIRIVSFPTNTTSITIGGNTYHANVPSEVAELLALVIPTDGSGNPTGISLDPDFDFAGTSVITFKAIDNAGRESLTPGTATINFTSPSVTLRVKVLLHGAVLGNGPGFETTMRDNLRSSTYNNVLGTRYIPNVDPYAQNSDYSGLFTKVGDGANPVYQTVINPSTMFADRSGTSTSAVDWVFIELRDKNNPATILGTRSAIVQQDGTVVDIDGSNCIRFPSLLNDDYYVAIRHRNHLGAMTALPKPATTFNCSSLVDFTTMTDAEVWHNPATPQYDGLEMARVTNTVTSTTLKALWAGNANTDNKVKYQGGTNDRTLIQSDVIDFPSNVSLNINYDLAFGYFKGDINLDSKAKYQGAANDRTILQSLVLGYLLNSTLSINYDLFLQQLP
ncbi:MAG: SdrD B-like domain-containing protein, partial [Bacteroidota bacterium]